VQVVKALRVLVIEDDALIAMMVAELLAGMGHEVCATASTEAEAVIAATRYGPDLMIVDAGLGQGSGVSAVEEVLRAGPVPHVFISGDAERVRRRKPNAVVVRKPFRGAELARAIDLAVAAASPPRKSEGLCGSGNGH
jgi:CheY-like chemotaxis protein